MPYDSRASVSLEIYRHFLVMKSKYIFCLVGIHLDKKITESLQYSPDISKTIIVFGCGTCKKKLKGAFIVSKALLREEEEIAKTKNKSLGNLFWKKVN